MRIIIDACGIGWEEQSDGMFVQIVNLGHLMNSSTEDNLNLLLDEGGVVRWRYLDRAGGRIFKVLETDLRFNQLNGSHITSIEGDVYRVTNDGNLFKDTITPIQLANNEVDISSLITNIPAERFLIGRIPNLLPLTSDTVIIVKSIGIKLDPSVTPLIDINDTIIYGRIESSIKPAHIHRLIESWEVKTNQDITNLLCWGLNRSLIINNSTQLMTLDDHSYIKSFFQTKIKVLTLSPTIMIEALTKRYNQLIVNANSILVRYINDGLGREFIIDINNRCVLDYRLTPTMANFLPKQDVTGLLSGTIIHSHHKVTSITYGWKKLSHRPYRPNALSDRDIKPMIWVVKADNRQLYYRTYNPMIVIGIFNQVAYSRHCRPLLKLIVPANTPDGWYQAVINGGRLTDLTPHLDHNISGHTDVESAITQEYFHHPDPFNISEAVLSIIKGSHRRYIHQQIVGIQSMVGDNELVVDLGAGRGGDKNRWLLFKHVLAVEPNLDNYTELVERIRTHSSITAINGYGQDLRLIAATMLSMSFIKARMIIMNDVLTFFHDQSLTQLAATINAITDVGSYLVFKVMDGRQVEKLLDRYGVVENGVITFRYGKFSIIREVGKEWITFSNSGIVGDNQIEYLFYPELLREELGWSNMTSYESIPNSSLNDVGKDINDLYRWGIWIR